MAKLSAGILAYKINDQGKPEVLLVHPGGPFWKKKDEGVWSIPKGEYEEGEDALSAAKREFTEETGNELPDGNFIKLDPVKIKSGKIVSVWAIRAEFETLLIRSNTFEMEWPPKSGKKQVFPEVDKAEWFTIEEAAIKINSGQVKVIEQLIELLSKTD